jgi:EAL domain-containing protein (putative c-di-GMP-specific phosphodiesterase class I)
LCSACTPRWSATPAFWLETSALDDVDQASAVIAQCGQLGVAFAMDDFGTGYSSLTYLKRLHVKVLKIDQSFVREVHTNPEDTAILKSIIGLAAAFQCSVIAEGVETTAHGSALLALGCELAQGYGIARPMPAEQLAAWVSAWRPAPEWLAGGDSGAG